MYFHQVMTTGGNFAFDEVVDGFINWEQGRVMHEPGWPSWYEHTNSALAAPQLAHALD